MMRIIHDKEERDRYKVTAWHGEGSSIFYLVDCDAPDDEQPCIKTSFQSRDAAISVCNICNGKDK